MKFLLDTNVFLNWLIEQNTKHTEASTLILSCLLEKAEGFITSHSLTDIFYVLRKYHNLEQRRNFMLIIASNFTVLTEDNNSFLDVLNASDFFDLEDGMQMKCAENELVDYIVTENIKDFKNSKIPAIDINSALKLV